MTLDSLVYAYWEGHSPETIAQAFWLTPEQVLLVTISTMPQHFAAYIQAQTSAGVLLVPQRLPVTAVVEDLLLIWVATAAEDWHNGIASLPL